MTPLDALKTEAGAMRDLVACFPTIIDADPLDTAKRAASKLSRRQRRDLMVHLMEQDNG